MGGKLLAFDPEWQFEARAAVGGLFLRKFVDFYSRHEQETTKKAKATKTVRCFKCGEHGHTYQQCRFEKRVCRNCKQPGHKKDKCPGVPAGEAAAASLDPFISGFLIFLGSDLKGSSEIDTIRMYINYGPQPRNNVVFFYRGSVRCIAASVGCSMAALWPSYGAAYEGGSVLWRVL